LATIIYWPKELGYHPFGPKVGRGSRKVWGQIGYYLEKGGSKNLFGIGGAIIHRVLGPMGEVMAQREETKL